MIQAIQQFLQRYKVPSILTATIVSLLGAVWSYQDRVVQLYSLLNLPPEITPQISLSILILLFGLVAWSVILHSAFKKQEKEHQEELQRLRPKHEPCPKCLEPEFKLIRQQPHSNLFFANSGAMQRIYKCSKCNYSEARD